MQKCVVGYIPVWLCCQVRFGEGIVGSFIDVKVHLEDVIFKPAGLCIVCAK